MGKVRWLALACAGWLAATAADAAVTLVPSRTSVSVGDTVVFTIRADVGDDVLAFDATGGFSPALFSYLGADSDLANDQILFAFDGGGGTLVAGYAGAAPATTLGTISLRARAAGSGSLGLSGTAFASDGTGTAFLTDSGAITIAAAPGGVPEPAGWALMILGLGATGGALRARRRTAVALAA